MCSSEFSAKRIIYTSSRPLEYAATGESNGGVEVLKNTKLVGSINLKSMIVCGGNHNFMQRI